MRFPTRTSKHRLAMLLAACAAPALAAPPNFTRDIQPILSENCYQCHGPDAGTRKADIRFDEVQTAIDAGAIVPGDPAKSTLVERILSTDPDTIMPNPKSKKVLTDKQKQLISDWIAAGAKHEAHWAFQPVRKPALPDVGGGAAPTSPIDAFVLARLAREGLAPAQPADRETLLRRVTINLTGIPPNIAEMDAFLADTAPDAYEKVVDRLLASPRYGEQMAVGWLDAARFADTFGYQADRETHLWPWRDWVIKAFNDNMHFDEFLTNQLAGDLLPNATDDQRLATAFNRLHRQTNEGGSVEEEFRLEYLADRTETLGTAVLGLTLECARCHDHKFDPTAQKDFYQFSSFFASIDESGLYSHFTETAPTPAMGLYGPGQREEHAKLASAIAERKTALADAEPKGTLRFLHWLKAEGRALPERKPIIQLTFDTPPDANKLRNEANPDAPANASDIAFEPGVAGDAALFNGDNSVTVDKLANFERSDPFTFAMWLNVAAIEPRMVVAHRCEAASDAASRGYEIRLDDGHVVAQLAHFWPGNALCIKTTERLPAGKWFHVAATYDGSSSAAGLKIYLDGKPAAVEVVRDGLYRTIRYGGGGTPALRLGARFRDNGFKGGRIDDFRVYDSELTPFEVESLASGKASADLIAAALAQPDGVATVRAAYMLAADDPLAKLRTALHESRSAEAAFIENVPQIMVMNEMPVQREVHVLGRGNYLNKLDVVHPETPRFLPPMPPDAPRNRLGLARWLLMSEHPLTSRVAVNNLWARLFGRGLVATPEDFGAQGDPPAYPDLLDYLAARYQELHWDTKALLREIVLSATYRQSSDPSPEAAQRDPENALLAHGPRHRLSAEEIHDAALAASGLLVEKVGGPSVKPYQPEGIWKDSSGTDYVQDKGEALYRRGIYTYIKRTAPLPTMVLFDGTSRETCTVKRERTETPLQALALLNDPQYVEAARVLAQRVLEAGGANLGSGDPLPVPSDKGPALETIFRLLTSHHPTDAQKKILLQAYAEQRAWFAEHPSEATGYVATGESTVDAKLDPADFAAMTAIAQLVMNFDAFQMQR